MSRTEIVNLGKDSSKGAQKRRASRKRKREGGEKGPEPQDFLAELESRIKNGVGVRSKRRLLALANTNQFTRERADLRIQVEQMKREWENLRNRKTAQESNQLVERMFGLVRGRVHDLVFKHDGSRVVQSVYQFASQETREGIFQELKGSIAELSRMLYGHHLVLKFLQHCHPKSGTTAVILEELLAELPRLVQYRTAAKVVDTFYMKYATSKQKNLIEQRFFFPPSILKKHNQVNITMPEYLSAHPEQKILIMDTLKKSLNPLIEKGKIGDLGFLHKLLESHLFHAVEPVDVEDLKKQIVEIIHTKSGSNIAQKFIADADAKGRKVLLKRFKTHISNAAADEYGSSVLLQFLLVTDDTNLLYDGLLKELNQNLDDLIGEKHAVKLLAGIVAPVKKNVKQPETSKKDPETRRREVVSKIQKPLLEALEKGAKRFVEDLFSSRPKMDIVRWVFCEQQRQDSTTPGYFSSEIVNLLPAGPVTDLPVKHFLIASNTVGVLKSWVRACPRPFGQALLDGLGQKELIGTLLKYKDGASLLLILIEAVPAGPWKSQFVVGLRDHRPTATGSQETIAHIRRKLNGQEGNEHGMQEGPAQ